MLMRSDPFRDLDRLTQQLWGGAMKSAAMPLDAYRVGDHFIAEIDLPGVDENSIDVTVEKNVLTIRADRPSAQAQSDNVEIIAAERPYGTFTRELFLGEALDSDHIAADYTNGVLTLKIPIAETAKPRKVQITTSSSSKKKAAAINA